MGKTKYKDKTCSSFDEHVLSLYYVLLTQNSSVCLSLWRNISNDINQTSHIWGDPLIFMKEYLRMEDVGEVTRVYDEYFGGMEIGPARYALIASAIAEGYLVELAAFAAV